MQNICYLIAILIGGFLGYEGLEWYYLFIGGFVATLGYQSERPHMTDDIRQKHGEFGYFVYFLGQIFVSTIFPAIAYFIALQFN